MNSGNTRFPCLLAALAVCAAQTAAAGLMDFYGYPPTAKFPDMNGKVFFTWPNSDTDSYAGQDALGLRGLNEVVAGENGWVTHADGRFLRGDGVPLRFWAVNVTGASGYQNAFDQGRFIAKRGVNMVRVHGPKKSLFSGPTLTGVDGTVIRQMQDVVSAMKQHGIYTFVSNTFFIIELSVKASYGMPGYTQAWLDANPTRHVPYGLIYLDDALRAGYKTWLTELMTRPNPNEPGNTPLVQERAVAIVELINEDNLFFGTFNPDNWPPEMQAIQEKRFFEWVGRKYLDPDNPDDTVAAAAERTRQTVWRRVLVRDDPVAGRFQLVSALSMSSNTRAVRPRNSDQVEYLAGVQEGFYAEMTQHLRDLGYGGTVSANNWKTVNDERLNDIELATYTAAGVVDRHNYYSPQVSTKAVFYNVSPGDEYFNISALLNPRETPLVQKHVDGYPLTMSEQIWSQYTPNGGEAPMAVATYMSLSDMDAWVWFALDTRRWNTVGFRTWPVESPSLLGQFPAAALMYRRGDIAEAGTVLREGRTRADQVSLQAAQLTPNSGFDYFRDDPDKFPGSSLIDPAVALVGKAVLDITTDEDFLHPDVYGFIDTASGRITSMTGQVVMDTGQGYMVVDAPQSQAVNGFLKWVGPVATSDLEFTLENAYGAIIATSLDGAPIAASGRILVQAFTCDRRIGFLEQRIQMTYRNTDVTGIRVLNSGQNQYEVERVKATVRLKGMAARYRQASALDVNLYPRNTLTSTIEGGDVIIQLPEDTLYTVIELDEPSGPAARIRTRALPNGVRGHGYRAGLDATPAPGASWRLSTASAPLPRGLVMDPAGRISGTALEEGLSSLEFELVGPGGVLDTQAVSLVIEPRQAPWGAQSAGYKETDLGWLIDFDYPFTWIHGQGWRFVVGRTDPSGGYYLYRFGPVPGWIWTAPHLHGWYYDFSARSWQTP